jgi:hypothetical protein
MSEDAHFNNYHRVLNHDRWSTWVLSKLLLGLIVAVFLAAGQALPVRKIVLRISLRVIDDTLERRRDRQIKYKSWFHDAVRFTASKVSTSLGIRWLTLSVLVSVPWSKRLWALPFLTIPCLSPKTSTKLGKRHRTLPGWAAGVVGNQSDRSSSPVTSATPLSPWWASVRDWSSRCSWCRACAWMLVSTTLPSPSPRTSTGPSPSSASV